MSKKKKRLLEMSTEIGEGRPIIVKWFDAWRNPILDVAPEDITDTAMVLQDIGFYVKNLNGYLVMAEERMDGSSNYRHIHYIPEVNILEILLLGL